MYLQKLFFSHYTLVTVSVKTIVKECLASEPARHPTDRFVYKQAIKQLSLQLDKAVTDLI